MTKAAEMMSPQARLERAKRRLAEDISEIVEAQLAMGSAQNEWVDQRNSPLGRRRHLELVRTGALPATRDGRRVLVRRAHIEAYLEQRQVIVADEKTDEDREVARVIEAMARKGAAPARARRGKP